jgi:hypothetical protein
MSRWLKLKFSEAVFTASKSNFGWSAVFNSAADIGRAATENRVNAIINFEVFIMASDSL